MGTISDTFASLFETREAQERLSALGPRVQLRTFNLATTSLRHLNKWLDRLQEIADGRAPSKPHSNYYTDPASVGLVDCSTSPPQLTPAGAAFLETRGRVGDDEAAAEYELLRVLYFGGFSHAQRAATFLAEKQNYVEEVLRKLTPTASSRKLISEPSLLVIAELIADFPGAAERLVRLSESDLQTIAELGEDGFASLCPGRRFPRGLDRLCRKIGGEYTRAEERRLHYAASMALLTIREAIPDGRDGPLVVPYPYSNLFLDTDLYALYGRYASDISIWFEDTQFRVARLGAGVVGAAGRSITTATLRAQTGAPSGRGTAPPGHVSRAQRRASRQRRVSYIVDQLMSERAEDCAEEQLKLQYPHLVRAGHRQGEVLALPDGLVPGADFYSLGADGNPEAFIEIKGIVGGLPADVTITRAEYMRAQLCDCHGVPYRLILVSLPSMTLIEVADFAAALAALDLDQVVQFVVHIAA